MAEATPPSASEGPFDFFVSYARADNDTGWISAFVEQLVAEHARFSPGRRLKPFFDKHAITTGADWQLYLAHGVAHSHLFLAFISPSYFASEWCRKEWRAWIDAEIAGHILSEGVRPIYVVEVPGLTGKNALSEQQIAHKIADLCKLVDPERARHLAETPRVVRQLRRRQLRDVQSFYDAGLDALRRQDILRVLGELANDLNEHANLVLKAQRSESTVPPYNRRFTGRLDELLDLRQRLCTDNRTGIISGIQGLGGIGKTELAFTYAHAFASAYPGGRFLIACEHRASLIEAVLGQADFTALFHDGISDEERKQPATYFAAIGRCLRERLNDEKKGHILLVLDNVANADLLQPGQTDQLTALGPKLHLLATTRLPAPPDAKGYWRVLRELPDVDALELMEKHRGFINDAERAAAKRIVKQLGGFTLAVELTAAFLAAHPESTSYVQLADGLGLQDLEQIAQEDLHLRRHNDERRLSAVLGPVLAGLTPEERRAMEYASLLAADQVPLPWLKELVLADFPELATASRLGDPWQRLVERLTSLALITRAQGETSEPRIVRTHRLLQELIRKQLEESGALAARQKAVNALIRERDAALEQTTRWQEAKWELEPLEALAGLWADTGHPSAAWLLNQVAIRWYAVAAWSRAEPLYRRALAICEASLGADHPSVASALNNLAQLLRDTNRLREAEPLVRRALAIDQASYGSDHPDVATDLNDLAGLLRATNRLAEAEPLYRRALAIFEASLGPDHPDVATALNNLAQLLQASNRLAEAEPLMRRALSIDEASYGSDHPDFARDLNNLASLLRATSRPTEAEPLYRRALAMLEASLGADHPKVANAINNLAELLRATNRLTEAEPLYRRALAIDEASYGSDHPDVARDLNNLALLLQATNRLAEAEPLYRRALAIDEASYGSDHPDVAIDLNNLALLLQATNRLAEAEPLVRRALAIDEASYGPDHPDVAFDLINLALLLYATNRLAEAEPLMRRHLEIFVKFTRSTGHPHPHLEDAVNHYAALLQDMGQSRDQIMATLRAMAPFLFDSET